MRWFSAFAAWVRVAALVLGGAFAGCQSNSDRDLIARDRRMQENQIYALQDYVKQYQQLVCQYRAENASLRSQLAEGSSAAVGAPMERSPVPPARADAPARSAPEFRTPIAPGSKEPQSPPPAAAPPAAAPETTPKNDSLLVPPLKSTRSGRSPRYGDQSSNSGSSANASTSLLLASYEQAAEARPTAEITATTEDPGTGDQTTGGNSTKPRSAKSRVGARISGEVVTNDSGGGPRLMIDVVPAAAWGGTESFEGKLSLMLLANGANGRKRNLGRWDFTRDDVHAARQKGENEQTLRFFIELPADISVNGETQLWAWLMPLEGGKSLVHAAVDLSGPGTFSSVAATARRESNPAAEPPISTTTKEGVVPETSSSPDAVATVSYVMAAPQEQETIDNVATALNESSWSIAMPGKPATLPDKSSDTSGHNGWRLSNEPMPTVATDVANQIGAKVEKSPNATLSILKSLLESKTVRTEELPDSSAPVPNARPNWSSQRAGAVSERTAARPNWSSKR